jgi:serine/threonine protein kinase
VWPLTNLSSFNALLLCDESSPWRTQRALLRTAQEVAKGLAYVHALGVVHADLKPANVLLQTHRGLDRRGYTARLADFGAPRSHDTRLPHPQASHAACGPLTLRIP